VLLLLWLLCCCGCCWVGKGGWVMRRLPAGDSLSRCGRGVVVQACVVWACLS
jgi:hypothetical protein